MTEREIFLEAMELTTPEARTAYLQSVCAGDVTLRRKVEALLVEHLSNDSLLAGPALDGNRPCIVDSPVEEAPAQIIGRYKLLERLGEGGFGEVWMAEQREPVKRRVALKIIKLGMDSRQIVARFEAERQALAMMDHPNIAKIFDAGTTENPLTPALSPTGGEGARPVRRSLGESGRAGEGESRGVGVGRLYFVMELVRGIKITEYCDQNQLATQERLRLFILVCQAIQHAHQKGIIHRDIKPSNILVTLHDGVPVPKVIDFGIAKATQQALTDKTVFTQFQQFIGTPAYISPEQAEMSGLDIDTRADIYSLGVLLYELLVGQTPFDAKEMMQGGLDALRQIIREKEPLRPSTKVNTLQGDARTTAGKRRQTEVGKLVHQLQGDLDWIVMKCLEKDRTRRYDTANGLAMDIQRHLANEPVVARPPSAAYRLQKAWQRNKVVFTAGAAVFLALAAGLTLAALGWIQTRMQRDAAVLARAGEETQRKRAQANEGRAIQERQGAEVAREETRRRAYAAEINVAFQALTENNLGRAIEMLNRQRPKSGEADLRGFEWRHLWQLCQSDAKVTFPDAGAGDPVFSPDGRWLAYGGDRIVIRELPSQAVVKTIPFGTMKLAFSPDGKLLAAGDDTRVTLWSTESWKEQQSLPDARFPPVFSPDGHWLVTGAVGGYRVWSTTTWQPEGFCAGEPEQTEFAWQSSYGVAFSPDGRLLVTAGHKGGHEAGQFQVWDFPSLTLRTNFSPLAFELRSAVFTPDSKQLLIGDQVGRLMAWDVAEGRVVETRSEHTSGISTIAFSRDGRTMATSSGDRTLVVWDWETRKVLVRLRGHLGEVWSVAISPDGRMLASGSSEGTIMLWDTSTRRERRMLPECGLITGFSADGRLLVVRGFKDFRVWCIADGAVRTIPLDDYTHRSLFAWADVHGIEPYAVFGRTNGVLEHWNLATMSRVASWRVSETGVSTAALSGDGRFIAIGDINGALKLWEAATHREVRQFHTLGEELKTITFSPDGRLLAGVIDTGNPRVCIWDVNDGSLRLELKGHDRPRLSLAFSPDGKLLATGHQNNTALLWEIPSGNLRATLKGHTATVMGVSFSPDGKTLATGSYDRKVKLWNIATEQELVTLELLPGSCVSLRFSPDGRTLAAGSFVGNPEPYMWLWQVPSFEEIAAAEAQEKREP